MGGDLYFPIVREHGIPNQPFPLQPPLSVWNRAVMSEPLICTFCDAKFESRNALFRHLRDATEGTCGAHVASLGGIRTSENDGKRRLCVPRGPRSKERTTTTAHTSTATPGEDDATLWIGDLPRKAATKRVLHDILYRALPRGRSIIMPAIVAIHAKAYKSDGEWRGYALAVFRDKAEAEAALDANGFELHSLCGEDVPPFRIRVQRRNVRESPSTGSATPPAQRPQTLQHQDPPMRRVLACITRGEAEERLEHIRPGVAGGSLSDKCLVDELLDAHEASPPVEIRHDGVPLPREACDEIRRVLEKTRWPARPQRKRVHARHYMILKRKVAVDDCYLELKSACERIMKIVNPSFPYDTLAITEGFVGNAHKDDDQAPQYAISLGDFEDGGELVIDDGKVRHVISTKNAVACVDGRFTHWVRPWARGTRYSIIFVVLKPENFVARAGAVLAPVAPPNACRN